MGIRGVGLLAIVALLTLGASASAQVVGRVDLATVRVTAVPGPPSGDFWDGSIIGGLPGLMGAMIKNTSAPYYPDIEVCVGSRAGCRLVCVNAQLNADDPKLRPACGLQLQRGLLVADLVDANGQRQWRFRDLEFEVNEIGEDGSTAGRRNIGRLALYAGANPPILQPDRCSESEPCTRVVESERGPLAMSFTTIFAGTVPPPTLPGAPSLPVPSTFPGAPVSGAGGGSPPPRTTSPTTAPEPEGRIARLWNAATEWLDSWFADKWLPFVQGPGDTFPAHAAGQKLCCIHPNDVIQGWHNDCFVLSALAAIAMVSPGTIRNAIHDNGNGLYTVNFAGANQRRQVSVDSAVVEVSWWDSFDVRFPTWNPYSWRKDTRQPYEHAQPADGGVEVWPILMERAYGEIIGGQTATGEMLPISEAFKRGGDAGVVMGHITGRASTNVLLAPTNTLPQGFTPGDVITGFHEVVSTQAKLRSTLQTLEQLHRQNRIAMTAGSIGPCTGKSQWNRTNTSGGVHAPRTEPGEDFRCGALRADLVPNHAYYFKQYDDTTQRVELGNPFGSRDASLTLGEFGAWFRSISYNTLPIALTDCDCSVK
jgi:hypothetical protein